MKKFLIVWQCPSKWGPENMLVPGGPVVKEIWAADIRQALDMFTEGAIRIISITDSGMQQQGRKRWTPRRTESI